MLSLRYVVENSYCIILAKPMKLKTAKCVTIAVTLRSNLMDPNTYNWRLKPSNKQRQRNWSYLSKFMGDHPTVGHALRDAQERSGEDGVGPRAGRGRSDRPDPSGRRCRTAEERRLSVRVDRLDLAMSER